MRRHAEGGPEQGASRKCSTPTKACPCEGRGRPVHQSEFTQFLHECGVKISMDGKGRYLDNTLVLRLWRTVKYHEVYLKAYANSWRPRGDWKTISDSTRGSGPIRPWATGLRAGVLYGEQEAITE